MLNKILLLILGASVGGVVLHSNNGETYQFEIPEGWPEPVYDFNSNPISESGFELGRRIFYDPQLSRDGTISCASCHLQYTGFTHVDHSVSHGIEGRKGTRNSPVLINLAWNSSFHWDGGVNNLNAQGLNPIQHPAEMDNSLANVLAYINGDQRYRNEFFNVFGDSIVTTDLLMKALTQFTVSLVSANSKYDKFKRGEMVFSEQESNGYKLFQHNCGSCHKEPLFSSNDFSSNGLPLDTAYNDLGRYSITRRNEDSLKFRIPTLRNIEFTFPYMHDGRFRKLSEVLDHYAHLNLGNKYLSDVLSDGIHLSEDEQKDIIAFLKTLTDKEFLYNQKFSFPRE